MRKLIAASAALALALSINTGVVSLAQAGPNSVNPGPASNIIEFCKTLSASDPLISVGECVHWQQMSPAAVPTLACDVIRDHGVLETLGFKNYGDCVLYVKSIL